MTPGISRVTASTILRSVEMVFMKIDGTLEEGIRFRRCFHGSLGP